MDQICYCNIDNNDKPFNNILRKQIINTDLKETDIHFQIERVQSRSINSETFDNTVELKSRIKNGAGVIKNDRRQKSTGSSGGTCSRKDVKRKSVAPIFFLL